MARQKALRSKEKGKSRGPRGRRGPAGAPAENGELVHQLGSVLARVTQELEVVQGMLRVQFTRIAELQAEVDNLRLLLQK